MKKKKTNLARPLLALLTIGCLQPQLTAQIISGIPSAGFAPLVTATAKTAIYVDNAEAVLVKKAAAWLQQDIAAVTGKQLPLIHTPDTAWQHLIVIGTTDQSALLQQLAASKRISFAGIAQHWEAYQLQRITFPTSKTGSLLVIAGSDKRGVAYGVFELSRQMGVSPWHWWADVPVKQKKALYIPQQLQLIDSPQVKYRGLFINDEAPALSGWTHEKYGGFNHHFYERVFELILRLKGNYLWPAMWGNAFNDDDTLNPVLANDYGIVMGTSHHEPMLRAQTEWKRYGKGHWNYLTNNTVLKDFWTKGIQHMGNHESIVTIGMRGDGDEPMTEGTAIELLEKIVKEQRSIITNVTGKPAAATPQLWALYKEVQEYYDKGMRVPDDVTLLLCDDNWGNIRKLPSLQEKPRAGGYGIYYHFDYVGDPRNYKWLNTNPLPRIWEQMHLAYAYNARKIWIVNVGDIKPMEFPLSFFLDYAWNPERIDASELEKYTQQWATAQFGATHAKAIASILSLYGKYNARRKPELLSPDTYSLLNYQEAETVVADYSRLLQKAEAIGKQLPASYQDAYFQLVLHPVKACSNINALYLAVAKNRQYARQQRVLTNTLAAEAARLYEQDSLISIQYNLHTANGKWNHMMDQTHIGYTYWQQPLTNSMPVVQQTIPTAQPVMGVEAEGSEQWWPASADTLRLPAFHSLLPEQHYLTIFNQGTSAFPYTITSSAPWLTIQQPSGTVTTETRIWLSLKKAVIPNGMHRAVLTITGGGKTVYATTSVYKPAGSIITGRPLFTEHNGAVAIEAAHYTRQVNNQHASWKPLPDLGRTLSAVTPWPVTPKSSTDSTGSPALEYEFLTTTQGPVRVQCYFSPTLNFLNTVTGLRYAISVDNGPQQVLSINSPLPQKEWEQRVADNITISPSQHVLPQPGRHVLRIQMVDPGVVLQKIVVNTGGEKASYLGPAETLLQ